MKLFFSRFPGWRCRRLLYKSPLVQLDVRIPRQIGGMPQRLLRVFTPLTYSGIGAVLVGRVETGGLKRGDVVTFAPK